MSDPFLKRMGIVTLPLPPMATDWRDAGGHVFPGMLHVYAGHSAGDHSPVLVFVSTSQSNNGIGPFIVVASTKQLECFSSYLSATAAAGSASQECSSGRCECIL